MVFGALRGLFGVFFRGPLFPGQKWWQIGVFGGVPGGFGVVCGESLVSFSEWVFGLFFREKAVFFRDIYQQSLEVNLLIFGLTTVVYNFLLYA